MTVLLLRAMLFSLLFSSSCLASDGKKPRQLYLVTAKAVQAVHVRDNSHLNSDGSYTEAPATYRFKLKDIKVEQGPASGFPKTLYVELDTRSDEFVLGSNQIYIVFDNSFEKPRVLKWGLVSRFACVPQPLTIDGYESHYFPPGTFGDQGAKCTFIDDLYQHPDADDEK